MPLLNACNLTLPENTGGLPSVASAIMSLLQPVVVTIVTQQMINGYYKTISNVVKTQASIQPLPQNLEPKMEGERNWRWSLIHILPVIDLQNNNFITLFGVQYKVMKQENWTQYGYRSYFVVEAFQNA